MDNLKKTFEDQLTKIQDIEDAISLVTSKQKYEPQFLELNEVIGNVKDLSIDIQEYIKLFKTETIQRYADVMNKLRKQEMIMLKMEEEIDEKVKTATAPRTPQPLGTNNHLQLQTPASSNRQMALAAALSTPMYLHQFAQTPLSTCKKVNLLAFLDFEATITKDDFESLPKYMRGRDTVAELQDFLDSIVKRCFNEKYSLCYKARDSLKFTDRNVWQMYKDQDEMFPGKKFITKGDLVKSCGRMLDKKMFNRITMLKHLNILKEVAKKQTSFYFWNINCEN